MIPVASPFRPGGQYFALAVGIALAVLVVGLAAWFFISGGDAPAVAPEPTVTAPAPAPAPPPAEDTETIDLPPLNDSDALVGALVSALTAHPGLAAWLIPDDLVRRFVVAVENVANGRNPARHLMPLRPTQRVLTAGAAPRLTLDRASYARYDTHAEIVASIDPAGAADLYRTIRPLISAAYAELGHPEDGFDGTLRRALENLLRTPVVEREVVLVPRAAFFEFADAELEDLLPVQKQFLGMGPRNVSAVQASLLAIAAALGIDPAGLPTPAVIR